MIVRQSPTSTRSPSKAAWPPRSPREAVQFSPSRQKRLREMTRDGSPSPLKRRRTLRDEDVETGSEEDEDEETLRLQLREIQARLKLKKLQKAKQKTSTKDSNAIDDVTFSAIDVQVPHSPKAPLRAAEKKPDSPRRVQLGIDKGLRAAQVSLKKAKASSEALRRATGGSVSETHTKRETFSERLLDARSQDLKRAERRDRLGKSRSHGFGLASSLKQAIAEPSSKSDSAEGTQKHKASARDTRYGRASSSATSRPRPITSDEPASTCESKTRKPVEQPGEEDVQGQLKEATEDYDSFSDFHLSQRHIDHQTLSDTISDKTVISIPSLLRQVTSPHYDPPDCEDDYVVLGIIASKSTPHNHALKHQSADPKGDQDSVPLRSKFMVLKLTNLKWELDLFLFDTAFERFWKLTEGTVVALLNPAIMPPRPHMRDTGQFSLKLASSEDTVLEIGLARDLGWCKSVKKDGKPCGQWVDKGKTEFCDFHVSLGIDRARAGRMEINGMVGVGLFGNSVKNEQRGGGGGARGRGGRGGKWNGKGKSDKLPRIGPQYDPEIGETAWVVPRSHGSGGNTARLLDAEDYVHGGMSKSERSQKRFAAKEKERELAKALGSSGSGVGSEYLRLKRGDAGAECLEQEVEAEKPKDAAALGLVGGAAADVTLGPVKRRRPDGNLGKAEPMGWGGAYKRGLLSPSRTAPERSEPQPSSSKGEESGSPRKRARFLLGEKGIRIPGRESLAVQQADDEDDLVIV